MNTKRLIGFIFFPLEKALKFIGSLVNQCPDKDELRKLRNSPMFNNPFKKNPNDNFDMKKELNHKRDHHAKGSISTDSRIFNRPRK